MRSRNHRFHRQVSADQIQSWSSFDSRPSSDRGKVETGKTSFRLDVSCHTESVK